MLAYLLIDIALREPLFWAGPKLLPFSPLALLTHATAVPRLAVSCKMLYSGLLTHAGCMEFIAQKRTLEPGSS
jgi:hypothetical protein